jgi:DNA-binding MarR family transcriptional regulator
VVPPPSAPSLHEARTLTMRLYRVADLARADFTAVVAELGLTSLQARVLLQLEEPTPMRSLAEHLGCDASNVTGSAHRLTEAGLVERVEGRDRRVKLLRLTPQGARVRTQVVERVAAGATVTTKLDAGERVQLTALLDKLLT